MLFFPDSCYTQKLSEKNLVLVYQASAKAFARGGKLPQELTCPLSQTFMFDPVVTMTGDIFDRLSINSYWKKHANQTPFSKKYAGKKLFIASDLKRRSQAFQTVLATHVGKQKARVLLQSYSDDQMVPGKMFECDEKYYKVPTPMRLQLSGF